jgi:hypothetical protein
MGNGQSNEAVDGEEPEPTPIPSSTVSEASGEDVAYQEIVSEQPQGSDGMEPFRRAAGMDVTGGSLAVEAVDRGGNVTVSQTVCETFDLKVGFLRRSIEPSV